MTWNGGVTCPRVILYLGHAKTIQGSRVRTGFHSLSINPSSANSSLITAPYRASPEGTPRALGGGAVMNEFFAALGFKEEKGRKS